MAINVNEKITDKVREGSFRKEIKEFLRDILIFELEHFEEASPRYMERYEDFIRKYTFSRSKKR